MGGECTKKFNCPLEGLESHQHCMFVPISLILTSPEYFNGKYPMMNIFLLAIPKIGSEFIDLLIY